MSRKIEGKLKMSGNRKSRLVLSTGEANSKG